MRDSVGCLCRLLLFLMATLLLTQLHRARGELGGASRMTVQRDWRPVAAGAKLSHENEGESGECALVLTEELLDTLHGGKQPRQICLSLQGYGFLTRYIQAARNTGLPKSRDVCLLLSFCGDECQRLYGHRRHNAAALNYLPDHVEGAPVVHKQQPINEEGSADQSGNSFGLRAAVAKPLDARSSSGQNAQSQTTRDVSSESSQMGSFVAVSSAQEPHAGSASREPLRCSRHFMSTAARGSCRSVYTLDFEAHNQRFSRFLARIALLIGAADIERVVDIERQIQTYIHAKRRRMRHRANGAPLGQKHPNSRNSENLRAYSASERLSEDLSRTDKLAHHLSVVLEPSNDYEGSAESFSVAAPGADVQSIKIIFPSTFKAVVHTREWPNTPIRRLRGSNYLEFRETRSPSRKPAPAEILLSTFAHCREVAAYMSMRQELQWLHQYIYFAHSQK